MGSLHRAFHNHTCEAVNTLIAGIKARGPGSPVDMCDILQVGYGPQAHNLHAQTVPQSS